MSLPTLIRPTGGYPGWASGVSGAVRITEPTQTEKNIGWQVGISGGTGFYAGVPPSTYFNWLQNLYYQWIKFADEARGSAYVGDGSDGNITLVATTYVQSRAMQFADIAIGASGVLDTNGWPVYGFLLTGVSGVLRSAGGPGQTGLTGAGNPYGGVPGAGPLAGQYGQGSGYFNASGISADIVNAIGAGGGTGGRSFTGDAFGEGFAGRAAGPTGVWKRLPLILDGLAQYLTPTGTVQRPLKGGAGGAAGGLGFNAVAGGGGAGGGFLVGAFGEVNFQGMIDVRGGDGGAGFQATGVASAGGGGGGGGRAALGYGRKTRLNVTYDARGGRGGIPGSGGSAGTGYAGITGATFVEIQLP